MEDLVKIGYVAKPHALKGELKVSIEEAYEELFFDLDVVILNIKGQQIPFFVESIRGGNELIVKFEDVDNKEKALEISSKEIFIRQSDLPEDFEYISEGELDYAYLEGYELFDKTLGFIAKIEEVLDMPQQEMALIVYKNKDVLIPLNDDYIIAEDEERKTIMLDIPDGLLDL